jgi:hypothetical protein
MIGQEKMNFGARKKFAELAAVNSVWSRIQVFRKAMLCRWVSVSRRFESCALRYVPKDVNN